MINPRVSVIIPTLNGAADLPNLLSEIKSQTIKVLEIIVIDSQSIDATVEISKQYGAKVINIQRDEFDHGGTRNYAASKALGDILVFMTQDAVPENKKTIENLIKPFDTREIVVSYARQIPKPNTNLSDAFLRLHNYPPVSCIKSKDDIPRLGIKVFQNSNVCAAYRRKEFEALGGFPEPIVSNEDMLYATKAILAGYKVSYSSDARVLHSHNYRLINLFKRYFDIGASLDNQPLIKKVGRTESKGFEFIFNQIKYIKTNNQLNAIPKILLEAVFKYIGFKIGENHHVIPLTWKKYLGLQANYWSKTLNYNYDNARRTK